MKRDGVSLDAKRAEHRTERKIQIQKDRPCSMCNSRYAAAFFSSLSLSFYAFEINADVF